MAHLSNQAFVIMPSNPPPPYSEDHWNKVFVNLIAPALQKAGMQPKRAEAVSRSGNIVFSLIEDIESSRIVLADLSGFDPNVFFELGWVARSDRPIILIKDDRTSRPANLGAVDIYTYRSSLRPKPLASDTKEIASRIIETLEDPKDRGFSSP